MLKNHGPKLAWWVNRLCTIFFIEGGSQKGIIVNYDQVYIYLQTHANVFAIPHHSVAKIKTERGDLEQPFQVEKREVEVCT